MLARLILDEVKSELVKTGTLTQESLEKFKTHLSDEPTKMYHLSGDLLLLLIHLAEGFAFYDGQEDKMNEINQEIEDGLNKLQDEVFNCGGVLKVFD